MNVYGYQISQDIESACLERMRARQFEKYDIECIARANSQATSISWMIARLFVIRLIQRERKAGHLIHAGKMWRWKLK